jgi:CAP12/Pycsar effector protein, TIR domain
MIQPEAIVPKRQILCLLRFGQTFDRLRSYVEEAGYRSNTNSKVLTVEEAAVVGPMEEFPLDLIKRCDLIICDVTEKTPNIIYVAGYATALRKDIILICESSKGGQKGMKNTAILEYELDEDKWMSSLFVNHLAHEIDRRFYQYRDLFFGYCSRVDNTAARIRTYLESRGFSVLDWARDFRVGRTILEEVGRAAILCRCGLFLFTADDPLEGVPTPVTIPRDNVILEAGYFISAHGSERVIVVQEKGVKMPSDLGGLIYLSMENREQWEPVAEKVAESLRLAIVSV